MCSTVVVTAEPAISTPSGMMPSSIIADPGDTLSINSGNCTVHEVMRLLDKGADGKTWYLQRQWVYGNVNPYSTVAPGGTLDMMSPQVWPSPTGSGMHVFWDSVKGPHGEPGSVYQDVLPPNHTAYSSSQYGSWAVDFGLALPGSMPGRLINPAPPLTMGLPAFNGQSLSLSFIESHPSLPISNPPEAAVFNQEVDNHPYFGAYSYVTASNVTWMGGQLYRLRALNPSPTIMYKQIQHFANSGNRAMTEVSGPTVRISTGAGSQFQFCIALNVGECYAGSQSGDVFFNAPGVTLPFCNNNWLALQTTAGVPNDICLSQANSFVQSVRIQGLANDPSGLGERTLSNALDQYDSETIFWNSRTLPDGSWLFTNLAADSSIKLIKIPPAAVDSEVRTGYVAVPITIPAGLGANAVIAFGYVENGHPANFYCTARQETCIAHGGGTGVKGFGIPFYFAVSEAAQIFGEPCAGGCTIAIPAIPGRVLYYLPIFSATHTFVMPASLQGMAAIAVN